MKIRVRTMAQMAARGSPLKASCCSICLAEGNALAKGICTDRAACESRQPPLFETEEALSEPPPGHPVWRNPALREGS